ncbi:MAG: carbohydrate ABC transporter permease [Anaerolineales bacterium]|nr:carbohydrate ABC transporter permease [Anaerolineales bacterium]
MATTSHLYIPTPVQRRITGTLLVLFFILLGVVALIPFASIVLTSFKDSGEIIRNGFNLTADFKRLNLENYEYVFSGSHKYFRWFGNSLLLTFMQTASTLFVSAWVGYGFAFYEFKGKTALLVCVLILMMIPFEILMIPLYKEIIALKLPNTYWGVILPYLAHPIAIFFFMQFMKSIPREIVDSGRIDGCSEYGIFLRLILPTMKPALAAMAIFLGMASWNAYLWPLLVIKDSSKFTLPIGLSSLMTPYGNNYQLLIAGSVLSILPIVILFISMQKFFIEGMTAGSVKG